jgi:hypothetical protein
MSVKETIHMTVRRIGSWAATLLLAAVVVGTFSARMEAQTPDIPKKDPRDSLDKLYRGGDATRGFRRGAGPDAVSPEVRARLFDGRMAMIREALRLNEAQLELWTPVEAQLRASFAARQKVRAERREKLRVERPFSADRADRPSLADRLDRRSRRLAERADRAKALAEAFRPFYTSLSDEQKTVAALVLRRGQPGAGRRSFMRRAFRDERK